jgi:dopamine beta-monooxygenase
MSTSDTPLELDPSDSCFEWPSQIIWAWGTGGQEFMLPPEAGILVGHTGPTATFVLQVHYNNPLGMPFADNDGIDLLVTKQLRPNRASVFSQGDIYSIAIPGGQPDYEYIATCDGNLTDGFFPEPINVVGVLLHAHELGKRIRTDVIRGGMDVGPLHEEDPYDFSSQSFDAVDFVIEPGDTLQTHCWYDSTGVGGTTMGGAASDEEMCINFMMYWPYVDAQTCGLL